MTRQTVNIAALDTPQEVLETGDAGSYQYKVDVSNMVSGDEIVIRGYQKADGAGNPARYFATARINYDLHIDGDPDADDMFVPLPWSLEAGDFVGIELTMTLNGAALPRSFDVSRTNLATFS